MLLSDLRYAYRRRNILKTELKGLENFRMWEESCVPSYLHPNIAAAYISWQRLFLARNLAHRYSRPGTVLDFGASIGELCPVLNSFSTTYHYIEADDFLVSFIRALHPEAIRKELEENEERYQTIFALDSLEHNDHYGEILKRLCGKLSDNGVLILSGPTENAIYRLGRKFARFNGHYHKTTIYDIEESASSMLKLQTSKSFPALTPLFRLSAWTL